MRLLVSSLVEVRLNLENTMKLNNIITAAFAASLTVACAGVDEPSIDEGVMTESGIDTLSTVPVEERPTDGEALMDPEALVATVDLDSGSRLHFIEVAPAEVGVLEEIAPGAASIATIEGIDRDANPIDVFKAFSVEGTPVPDRLLAAGEAKLDVAVQGWARPLLDLAPVSRAPCNNTDITNYINGFNYNDRGTPDFRFNKYPDSSGYFDDQYENWYPGYYFYGYKVGSGWGSTWYNVDRYITYVAVCSIDSYDTRNPGDKAHPSISIPGYSNSHMGPQVRFSRRSPSASSFSTSYFKDFSASEAGTAVAWHFYSASNYDWRTEIDWAGGDDYFDIAHALEDL